MSPLRWTAKAEKLASELSHGDAASAPVRSEKKPPFNPCVKHEGGKHEDRNEQSSNQHLGQASLTANKPKPAGECLTHDQELGKARGWGVWD